MVEDSKENLEPTQTLDSKRPLVEDPNAQPSVSKNFAKVDLAGAYNCQMPSNV